MPEWLRKTLVTLAAVATAVIGFLFLMAGRARDKARKHSRKASELHGEAKAHHETAQQQKEEAAEHSDQADEHYQAAQDAAEKEPEEVDRVTRIDRARTRSRS